ncbi:antitoxin VbhA family protein [Curtobacterium sp. Arg-1]|uniref:antitoxin VbhA family protein n=1 Tax=Curtobacterium sp. Arg-1 TaxID=2935040 RepID=UPI0021DA2CDC|nr:antitoxin VbhA family protein [Curtobacterium sp. Arg-1]UXZ57973.1 antitoxin VbhA family protein [Curtobacterium sp. Arg-1]
MSMHLSNDRILWGHVLLEDTENPDAHLAQILVRPIDVEPGYELYDKTNTVLSDLTVPAVREANRIVQTLLIPASEIAKREKAVRAVIHSGYLEGFPDDMPWQSQLWMYARGEVTREQLSAYADEGRQIPRQPEHSAVGPADVPEDWWQATQARIRRHLLNTTLTEVEVAAALQISIDEVGELFESNRLTSFDLDGEERIPDWQLVKPALPEFGDPASLLPGLDVLYAAAPQPLLDAAAMTEFMTTPLEFLTVDDRILTPLDWMREGRPLTTIIALFRGRRWRP